MYMTFCCSVGIYTPMKSQRGLTFSSILLSCEGPVRECWSVCISGMLTNSQSVVVIDQKTLCTLCKCE